MDRPRVLVIDPHPETESLIRKVLEKLCDLLFRTDPLTVFDTLELFEPDLIIFDLELPYLSGFELLSLIKSEPAFAFIPVMVFSATHDVESQKLAYRLGALHFQTKPCRPSQLFKGACMFARIACDQRICDHRPAKRLPPEQVRQALEERAGRTPTHPLLAAALAAHERRQNGEPRAERSILASVVSRHPAP